MKIDVFAILTAALAARCGPANAQGFGGLLDPVSSVLGSVTSPFGPINIVGSPAIDVDTRVGSPSTVIDKAPPSSKGINIVTPSFVRVKTDVDSAKTEIKTAPGATAGRGVSLVGSPAIDVDTRVGSPSTVVGQQNSGLNVVTPSFVKVKTAVDSSNTEIHKPASATTMSDPDVAAALAPQPSPTTVAALTSLLGSLLGTGLPSTSTAQSNHPPATAPPLNPTTYRAADVPPPPPAAPTPTNAARALRG